jgi:hypothetical protein
MKLDEIVDAICVSATEYYPFHQVVVHPPENSSRKLTLIDSDGKETLIEIKILT